MAAVASIQITVDEKGAVTAINNLTNAIGQTEPALRRVGDVGNVVMTDLVKQHQQAHDAAILLGRTLGVELPRQLDTFLAKSQTIAPMLAQAFDASITVAFAAAAITAFAKIPGFIDDIVERMTHWKAEAEAVTKAISDMNKELLSNQAEMRKLDEEFALIGLSGNLKLYGEQQLAIGRVADAQQKLNDLIAKQAPLVAKANEMIWVDPNLGLIRTANSTLVPAPGAAAAQEQLKTDPLNAQIKEAQSNLEVLQDKARNAGAILGAAQDEAAAHVRATTAAIKQQQDAWQWVGAGNPPPPSLARPGDIMSVEQALQLGEEAAFKRRSEMMSDQGRIDAEYTSQVKKDAEEQIKAQQKAAEEWTRQRDQLANSIDNFFHELSSGGIGQAFLREFEKMVSTMVATWLMGVNAMQTGTAAGLGVAGGATGSGGILGTIFGALGMKVPGSSGPGATPPFVGGGSLGPVVNDIGLPLSGGASLAGLPLSAGGLATMGSALPAGASVSGATPGGGGILGRLGLGGGAGALMQLFGGAELAKMIGFGNPVSGALAGGIGTALGLSAISALAPSVLGTAIGGLFGPIGIGIGAGIGALIGIFSNGKRASQRHDLQMQEFRDLQTLDDQFKFGNVDYSSARTQLEQMRQAYVQQFEQLHGKRDFVDPFIDEEIAKINQLETQREQRQAVQFAPAQFRLGGLVGPLGIPLHFADGGEVPAILHAGEFVMRPEAVRQQGISKLQAMNDGRSGGARPTIIINHTVNAWDARSVERYYTNGGGLETLRKVLSIAATEGRWS